MDDIELNLLILRVYVEFKSAKPNIQTSRYQIMVIFYPSLIIVDDHRGH